MTLKLSLSILSAFSNSFSACKNPYGLKNAVLEPGDNLIGTPRTYTCLPGYLATGPITSTCAIPPKKMMPDWSTPVHYCKGNRCYEHLPVDVFKSEEYITFNPFPNKPLVQSDWGLRLPFFLIIRII